jgi:hypothetical protein
MRRRKKNGHRFVSENVSELLISNIRCSVFKYRRKDFISKIGREKCEETKKYFCSRMTKNLIVTASKFLTSYVRKKYCVIKYHKGWTTRMVTLLSTPQKRNV